MEASDQQASKPAAPSQHYSTKSLLDIAVIAVVFLRRVIDPSVLLARMLLTR